MSSTSPIRRAKRDRPFAVILNVSYGVPSGENPDVALANSPGDRKDVHMDVDYGINYHTCRGYKMANIDEPSYVILLTEQEPNTYVRWWNQGSSDKNYPWKYDRHNGGCNYVFVDGHARWASGQRVPHTTWPSSDPPTIYATREFRMEPTWP